MAANMSDALKIVVMFFLIYVTSSMVTTIDRWDSGESNDLKYFNIINANGTEIDHSPTYLLNQQDAEERLNFKPIIAILVQEVTPSMKRMLTYDSYIASSYIKFLEAAGARVVPAFINQPHEYYKSLSNKVNGFFFPGGGLPVDSTSGFGRAGKVIMQIATKPTAVERRLPVWGTCLGFELILYSLVDADLRQRCQASNFPSSLKLYPGSAESNLFKYAPEHLLYNLSHKNITANFHHWCVTPKAFSEPVANEQLNILTTSFDENGLEYVSTMEHKSLPIYATQWHPEKSQFEWPSKLGHSRIPHGIEAVEASQYMANFFVEQARRNKNRYSTESEENKANIHNYKEVYLPPLNISYFQQCYFFS